MHILRPQKTYSGGPELKIVGGYRGNRLTLWDQIILEKIKREPHIGDMEILLSQSKLGITLNAAMI